MILAFASLSTQQLTPQQPVGLQGIPGGSQGVGVIPPGQQIAGVLPQNIYAFLKSNAATNRVRIYLKLFNTSKWSSQSDQWSFSFSLLVRKHSRSDLTAVQ